MVKEGLSWRRKEEMNANWHVDHSCAFGLVRTVETRPIVSGKAESDVSLRYCSTDYT